MFLNSYASALVDAYILDSYSTVDEAKYPPRPSYERYTIIAKFRLDIPTVNSPPGERLVGCALESGLITR